MRESGLFDKVASRRLYQCVVSQIEGLVTSGKIQPGERLPSEAELCKQLGVSRTVVREATKSLAERGLLVSHPGRGTFVNELRPQDLSASFDLFVNASDVSVRHVSEVREALEVMIAELAAVRATPEDIAKLERAVGHMDRNLDDLDGFLEGDEAFHNGLAETTRNPILIGLMLSLSRQLMGYRRMESVILDGNTKSQRAHKAILGHVRKRERQLAAAAMQEHLREVVQRYEAIYGSLDWVIRTGE